MWFNYNDEEVINNLKLGAIIVVAVALMSYLFDTPRSIEDMNGISYTLKGKL